MERIDWEEEEKSRTVGWEGAGKDGWAKGAKEQDKAGRIEGDTGPRARKPRFSDFMARLLVLLDVSDTRDFVKKGGLELDFSVTGVCSSFPVVFFGRRSSLLPSAKIPAMLRTARALNGLRRFSTLGSESFLSGTSSVYIEEMYAAYKKSPTR